MKKLKTIIACLILLCSCVIFASCQKGNEKVEFGETSPIVLEVGETYSPKVSVSPEKYLADLVLATSDSRVVVVSPDNKLVAVGAGTAQIEAKVGDTTANLVVEVVAKRTKLQTPVGFCYEAGQNRVVWSAVNNANSYDVEVDGVVVAKNLITNFFEIDSNVTKSVRIKANGIGKYSDSDFTDVFKFKNLQSPTNLFFNKATQTLTWDYEGTAKFRVCVGKLLLDVVGTKSCALSLGNAGVYDVCVVAVAEENQKDGDTLVFDSLRSQSLQITRLGDVDKNSIVWNASESLLTWGEIAGAKYRVVIGPQAPVVATSNNLTIQNLTKGNYEIKITAISDEPLVLDAVNAATSNVAITKQLQTPVIQKYDESANKLTLTDFGEAQNFMIFSNGQKIYDGDATILGDVAEITLPVGVFNEAGEYSLTAISKADEARFYTQSATSVEFVITRLAAPTNLRIENGKTLAFATLPQATFGYVVYAAGVETTTSEPNFNLFAIAPNTYEIKVKYLGNKNNILESANSNITVTKLPTPVLEFKKETVVLEINKSLSDAHEFDITINSSLQKNVRLENGEYNLSGMLRVGENHIQIQTLPSQNEILSNVAEIDVYQLEEIQDIFHESIGDVSYIKFSTNQKFDNFVVSLGDQTLDYTTSFEGEDNSITVLTLKDNTSQIFATAGEYLLTVEAKSTSADIIDAPVDEIQITKLQIPTNFTFEFPNKLSWNRFEDINNNFNLVITKNGTNVFETNTTENEISIQDLELGTLKAKIKVLGNGQDILDSNYCEDVEFSHMQLAKPQNVQYSNDVIIWSEVEGADNYEITIGQKHISQTNSFITTSLSVGQYHATIKAKNSADESITSEYAEINFAITRKLAAPQNLTFNKATRTLTFDGVSTAVNGADASASKYMVYVNGTPASVEYTNKTSFTFNSDAFLTAGTYALEVQAFGEGIYVEVSEKSEPLVVEKLAAPTSILINDETVSCGFNAEIVDRVEIFINGVAGTSLADVSGEIVVKAKYIGKTDLLIDSEFYQTTIYRLGKISDFRLENDVICWSPVANASGYVISIKPENENLEKFYLGNDVSSYAYDFKYEGGYSIKIYAQGGIVEGNQYLDSAHETIEAQKCSAPTNVKLEENPTTGIVTITFDYSGAENSTSKFDVFLNDVWWGECAGTEFVCDNTNINDPGIYEIKVKAVGKNSNRYVSSNNSNGFVTQRLINPWKLGASVDGSTYMVSFYSVSTETDYSVVISNSVTEGEQTTTTTIKDVIIEKSANWICVVDFSEEMGDNAFVEGSVLVTICALGNNSTLLNSGSLTAPFEFTPKPVVSHDADNLLISRTNESYMISIEYFVTIDGVKGQTTQAVSYAYVDSYAIPDSIDAGEITFIVRQWKAGEMLSAPTTYVVERLKAPHQYGFGRSETNDDTIFMQWNEVEGATGYSVVVVDEYGDGKQIYNGESNKFSLPLADISDGANYFFVQTLGGADTGFSSKQNLLVQRNKLSATALNLRNENGVIAWSDEMSGNIRSLSSGFKLVVTDEKGETVYLLDNETYSHKLPTHSGQLNIKLKRLGNFETSFGIDSDYAEINIVKLPIPTNVVVRNGEIVWDSYPTISISRETGVEGESPETIQVDADIVINIDGKQYATTAEGIQQLTSELLANRQYTATIQAKSVQYCLTSDESEEIVVKLLENPNANDGSTFIDTNLDKTISTFHWASATGASKYQVKIEGETLSEPTLQVTTDTKFTIPQLDAGNYTISVRRIGTTGAQEGVCYLSSGFSTPISFTVLSAPVVSVSNGELAWVSQDGANNYYLYVGDGYKKCGNVTFWTFLDEYKDFTKETEINLFLQAIGDGINFLASPKTSEIRVVKPRPPQMLIVRDGALCWNDLEGYTYFEDTENKKIYLDFIQNEVTYESFEIDVNLMKSGWPLDDNYLQKLTSNLPAGNYTLKIKQIGDSKKVITSEYAEQTFALVVAPNPTNVKIDEHKLQWDAVSLEDYGENEITYVVYAFDNVENDWVKLAETTATFLDVENTSGLLKPQHTALAVATKGNTTGAGLTNYVTGSMSEKVDIIVLGSTSDLQTVEGELTWGIVANAVNYRIESATNNMVVAGGVQASFLKGFNTGVHDIRIRALGNGTTKNGDCIINGVWGQVSTFTKLEKPVVGTKTDSDNIEQWGSFRWAEISFATGYNIYINNEFYNHIENNIYESDYAGSDINTYQFQAKGNSVTPSETNPAYISSDHSDPLARARMAKIFGVQVRDGKLYWLPSSSSSTIKYYFVEFSQGGVRTKRVALTVNDKDLVKVDDISMVEFDVVGYVQEGSYSVCVRETSNSDIYIAGVESDPIEISKLNTPSNVHLDNGILTWDNIEDATGYVVRLVSDTSTTNIVEGFSLDSETNVWRWVSNLESGEYRVSVRAVSTDENKLNSSWATKNGALVGDVSDWKVRQIPKIILGNISVSDSGQVQWRFTSSTANIPTNLAYQVWRKGEESFDTTPILTNSYQIDVDLTGIAIRTIPYGENEYDYFASVFSETKDVDRPTPPQDLTYDSTRQIFTWTAADTSDATYIVYYTIDGGEEQTFDAQKQNKFEPTKLGNYKVYVKVKKSESVIGTSEKSEEVEGVFNLFTNGEGTADSPFEVNATNFENIMFRPNSHFILTQDITRTNKAPLGNNGSKSPTQFLGILDGNNKTITASFAANQTSIWVGLFSELGSGAQVKNLKVEVSGDIVLEGTTTAIHAGAIAGCVNGKDAKIENCTVSGSVTILRYRETETRFGSFVGLLKEGTIKNCTSNLDIVSSTSYISKVGGIVGMVGTDSSTNAIVDSCINNGNISGANTIGGIAAYNYGTIKNSINNATITSETFFFIDLGSAKVSANSIAGGIVGENFGTKTSDEVTGGIVQNCQNGSDAQIVAGNTMEARDPNSFAGGIVGETTSGLIDQNTARGTISISTDNVSTSSKAQAIVGNFKSYSETSENFKASGLSQEIPSGTNMTVSDIA